MALARGLERDRRTREREGSYIAWGLHLAQEALRAGASVKRAYVGPHLDRSREGGEVLSRLRAGGVPLLHATTRVLESIAVGCGDQGIVLEVRHPRRHLAHVMTPPPSLVVVTHSVQDPGNLGSILRTAWALGAGGLIALEGCADPFGSRAVRAAMGAEHRVPVACSTTILTLAALETAGMMIVAADPYGPVGPADVDLRAPAALCVGSEGAGLPPGILQAATWRVRIPMAHGVSSLNVHAAAAVLLYEVFRQRGFGGAG